jgi:hypothetical protein
MDFFDTDLYEVDHVDQGVRYVLKRNPIRQEEMGANRQA